MKINSVVNAACVCACVSTKCKRVWCSSIPRLGWRPGRPCTCPHSAARPRPGPSRRWPRTLESRCAPGRWPSQPRELCCWWSCGLWWRPELLMKEHHGWAVKKIGREKKGWGLTQQQLLLWAPFALRPQPIRWLTIRNMLVQNLKTQSGDLGVERYQTWWQLQHRRCRLGLVQILGPRNCLLHCPPLQAPLWWVACKHNQMCKVNMNN